MGFTTLATAAGEPDTINDTQKLHDILNEAIEQENNRPTNSGNISIANLTFYDRDGDGMLNEFELNAVITDFLYERLTDAQVDNLVAILKYMPISPPFPESKIKPEIVEEKRERDGVTWVYQNSIGNDNIYSSYCIVIGDNNEAIGDVTQAVAILGSHNTVTLTNVYDGGIYFQSRLGYSNIVYLPTSSTPYIGDRGYDNAIYVGSGLYYHSNHP